MHSDLTEKLLILIMITLLPVSVFVASNYQQKLEKQQRESLEKEQIAKVNALMAQLQTQAVQNEAKSIEIGQVYYATQSGKLVVKGSAPKAESNILVSQVLTAAPTNKDRNVSHSASNSAYNVLGEAVDVVAIKSDKNGDFTFVKKISSQEASVIDLRFDQDQSSATIQFDLLKLKQLP